MDRDRESSAIGAIGMQVHDLLRIDPNFLDLPCVAMKLALRRWPWVVVRRERAHQDRIAVGVRGAARNERWGGVIPRNSVEETVEPPELLPRSRSGRTPALIALRELREKWRDLPLSWGPAGSVGFELATGCSATNQASDLDVVIRAPLPITKEYARFLRDRAAGVGAKVDIRVESPQCGFSLEEYASSASRRIVLRYPEGARLGDDPWGDS
jgi:phosphoribosyl-dephospho-CoA transferase